MALIIFECVIILTGLAVLAPEAVKEVRRRRTGEPPHVPLRRVESKQRYDQYNYTWSGVMYRFDPVAEHVCENRNEPPNGSIWICECGRAYVQRSVSHDIRAELRRTRRYWWRVRWFLPWSWRRAWIVRGLKRDRYQLNGEGSV